MREIPVPLADLAPYEDALGPGRLARVREGAARVRAALAGRALWQVNSTAAGGGVSELLQRLLPLARALGVDARWAVIDGDAEMFALTKRLCLRLYGAPGDGGPLGETQRRHFVATSESNLGALAARLAPGDVVVIHDPQPAGLAAGLRARGARVVFRCHIGSDDANAHSREGWSFLRPFLEPAEALVFSTRRHVPAWARARKLALVAPSIDPCGPRNMPLADETVLDVLGAIGVLDGGAALPLSVATPSGEPVVVRRRAQVLREGPAPGPETPMVVQVSRWDRLKDMPGVLRAFAARGDAAPDAHLALAGPEVHGVADDPEAAEMYDQCRLAWERLPPAVRRRCQLVCLPMADLAENAVMVNALQRHAAVVVQKSLAEGFGLTATEAMWKGRPLLASAVGGLQDQLEHGEHGLLLRDPCDPREAAAGLQRLLADRPLAERLGAAARRRVRERYLPDRHLLDWAGLLAGDLGANAS